MAGTRGNKGGRPRKHAVIREIEGNRGHRPILEPMPALGEVPGPPDHFTDDQAARFRFVVDHMAPGILATIDSGLIERYAVAWSTFAALTRRLNRFKLDRGPLVRIGSLVRLCAVAGREMQAAGMDLGMSPAARMKIGNPNRYPKDDPLDDLLGGGGLMWDDDGDAKKTRN